jgi:hypothetical protein
MVALKLVPTVTIFLVAFDMALLRERSMEYLGLRNLES